MKSVFFLICFRGVLSVSWCQADPELLLSSAKDNRILCWNPSTGEVHNSSYKYTLFASYRAMCYATCVSLFCIHVECQYHFCSMSSAFFLSGENENVVRD